VRHLAFLTRAATLIYAIGYRYIEALCETPPADRSPWPIPRNLRIRILSADRKCRTERGPGRGHRRRIVSRCLSVETFIAASESTIRVPLSTYSPERIRG
jgi:hypothetical protein